MGYAVILTHPSVPCIFWQDWRGENQAVIKVLLAIRERANISPRSDWQVVHGKQGLYAAFVGNSLAIKLGSADWSPNAGVCHVCVGMCIWMCMCMSPTGAPTQVCVMCV